MYAKSDELTRVVGDWSISDLSVLLTAITNIQAEARTLRQWWLTPLPTLPTPPHAPCTCFIGVQIDVIIHVNFFFIFFSFFNTIHLARGQVWVSNIFPPSLTLPFIVREPPPLLLLPPTTWRQRNIFQAQPGHSWWSPPIQANTGSLWSWLANCWQ